MVKNKMIFYFHSIMYFRVTLNNKRSKRKLIIKTNYSHKGAFNDKIINQ